MKDKELGYVKIPVDVLHCEKLTAGAKLLYGEIEVICNQVGYCRVQNTYFAKLYKTNVGTISRWVESLRKNHFIICEVKKEYIRVIFLKNTDKKYRDTILKNQSGAIEKSTDNTTYYRPPHLGGGVAGKSTDDFCIDTKEWKDKQGQTRGVDTIHYEEEKQ